MILLSLVAVAALVVVNGLFVATEFAVVASRPAVLDEAVRNGLRGAGAARRARGDLRRQLSGAQVLITISSVLLGILAEPAPRRSGPSRASTDSGGRAVSCPR